MNDEAAAGSARTPDKPGHHGGSAGEQSPLQARAQFLKNRDWNLIVSLNRGACARGGAQHGQNSESYSAVAAEWENHRSQVQSLDETIEFLRPPPCSFPFLQRKYFRRRGPCFDGFGLFGIADRAPPRNYLHPSPLHCQR